MRHKMYVRVYVQIYVHTRMCTYTTHRDVHAYDVTDARTGGHVSTIHSRKLVALRFFVNRKSVSVFRRQGANILFRSVNRVYPIEAIFFSWRYHESRADSYAWT